MNEVLPIQWIRRRNQKSIRIHVKKDHVVVSAPAYVSQSEMRRFYEQKKEWIQSAHSSLLSKIEQVENKNRFSNNELLFGGEWLPVDLKTGCRKDSFEKNADGFIIHLKSETIDTETISYLYANFSLSILAKYFYEVADDIGYSYSKLTFRNQKTKWGSCSNKGSINLNWRLIKCPLFVQEYIFVHELCHLKHLNHSKAYWNLVESHLPDYKKAEKWLKENGPVVFQNP